MGYSDHSYLQFFVNFARFIYVVSLEKHTHGNELNDEDSLEKCLPMSNNAHQKVHRKL